MFVNDKHYVRPPRLSLKEKFVFTLVIGGSILGFLYYGDQQSKKENYQQTNHQTRIEAGSNYTTIESKVANTPK